MIKQFQNTFDLRNSFIVSDVPNHALLKDEILSAINTMGIHSSITQGCSIYNTDWELKKEYPRPYWDLIGSLVEEQHNKIAALYKRPVEMSIINYWFQQYAFGGFHEWHLHGLSTYSNIYYVELPENSVKTSFIFLDEEFTIDVKEGQVLSAPSFLLHCSKPNQSNNLKTIIAFNTIVD